MRSSATVLVMIDEGPSAFDGRFDDAGQVHGLLPEIDLAPGDPADIQEVVDQPHEVGHLAVDHVARTDQSRVVRAGELEQVNGVADR